jgi:hypothetical protein
MAGIPLLFKSKPAAPAAPPALPVTAAAAILPTPTVPIPAVAPNTGSASYPAEFGSNVSTPPSVAVNPDDVITVSQNPLRNFLGDIIIPGGAITTIDVHTLMGSTCVGFVLIPVFTAAGQNIQLSINGGGFRTVQQTVVFDESVIETITISTIPLVTAILQLNGV